MVEWMAFTDVDEYIDPTPGKKRRIPQVVYALLPLMSTAATLGLENIIFWLFILITCTTQLSEAPVSESRTWEHMKEKLKQVMCTNRGSEASATKNTPILMPSSFGMCSSGYVSVLEEMLRSLSTPFSLRIVRPFL